MMRRELARLAVCVALLGAAVYCAPPWRDDAVLGVDFEWPVGSARHYREAARAICSAAELADDPRSINGASVVVLETLDDVRGACLQDAVACWHPDYDDPDGAGTIYVGPAGDGGPFADEALQHELGHLIRHRERGDSDGEHEDLDWWARYDAEILVCR